MSIFSHACWPPVCLLWRNVYLGLLPFPPSPNISCISCLYILEINPLLVASFANIFSQSVGCLFILFMASFAVKKFSSLIRSHLFIFVFISISLRDRSKKIYSFGLCQSVPPMYSYRSFIVSWIIFKSLIILSSFLCMLLENVLILFFYM